VSPDHAAAARVSSGFLRRSSLSTVRDRHGLADISRRQLPLWGELSEFDRHEIEGVPHGRITALFIPVHKQWAKGKRENAQHRR
jgi:hypothetical protein